ncbi:MAG: hypothetical protein M1835_006059 [Candelina submexicana]|nr:MAG: hypothetical protein M1835_006059 [Candelina submexicana]
MGPPKGKQPVHQEARASAPTKPPNHPMHPDYRESTASSSNPKSPIPAVHSQKSGSSTDSQHLHFTLPLQHPSNTSDMDALGTLFRQHLAADQTPSGQYQHPDMVYPQDYDQMMDTPLTDFELRFLGTLLQRAIRKGQIDSLEMVGLLASRLEMAREGMIEEIG